MVQQRIFFGKLLLSDFMHFLSSSKFERNPLSKFLIKALSHSQSEITNKAKKTNFVGNFTKVTFVKLLPPVMMQHLIKNPYSISWDVEMLGQHWTKIAYLTHEIIFLETSLKSYWSTYCSFLCWKIRKISLEVDPER